MVGPCVVLSSTAKSTTHVWSTPAPCSWHRESPRRLALCHPNGNVAVRLHTETGKEPLDRQQSNGSPKLTHSCPKQQLF